MIFLKGRPLITLFIFLLCCPHVFGQKVDGAATLLLNGKWQMGFGRIYTGVVDVPGIATDPAKMNDEALWYKKEIKLPEGSWQAATLELKGARFEPQVYINGQLAGKQQGGMAHTYFLLNNENIKPGSTITIEIALASLKNVPQSDASYIPQADHWRSNISSGLWDDVVLHLHGTASIERVIPATDFKSQKVDLKLDLNGLPSFKGTAKIQVLDHTGKVLISKMQALSGLHQNIAFGMDGKLKTWSPEAPNLYSLKISLNDERNRLVDQTTMAFGVKKFEIKNKQFYLNGNHLVARGATIVWHRWMRTQEGRELGYDTAWFNKNIIQRTKDLGGNYLRCHLGVPPERFLDLCDRYGLIVQYEWSFFHGMPASRESLMEQYKSWLDVAMRHPSVCLIHPYNETGGDQLKTVWSALDELLTQYPPQVLEERDVIHVHKYWWSLFENLGLYYDTADVFPKAIMADEFGGNYLDQNGDLGLYSTVKETFLRFLGRKHTKEERLAFHAQTNAKVAEYWRRIGAAGFSPFCALGSNEDGSSWFLGPLKEGNPKPVWEALTAAFSPQSVSVEVWDKDFAPSQSVSLPVYVFNDVDKDAALQIKLTVEDKAGKVFFSKVFTTPLGAFSKKIEQVAVTMPAQIGDYLIRAELLNKPAEVKHRVISDWDVRVYQPTVPENVKQAKIAVPDDEAELKQFLNNAHIEFVKPGDNTARVILTSLKTWDKLAAGDTKISDMLQAAIAAGQSVVMIDVGERPLGQGYPKKAGDLGPLQGVASVSNPKVTIYNLFGGISLKFTQAAEPESTIHPDRVNRDLWAGMPDEYTRLWNGMRGGLIAPAADMEFSGLSAKAFITQWKARSADEEKIKTGPYYAYELQGFYDFSASPNDADIQRKLKAKVNFLVQDAPSLASSINPNSPVVITDLAKGYRDAEKGMADNFVPLANCGKSLTRTPVAMVGFGEGKGRLVVSQLLTSGRLAPGFGQPGLYGIRYDGVAVQYVLNMISLSLKK